MILEIIIFIISSFVLARSSKVIVQKLVRIARFLKWSEFIVSFLIMSAITSFPELFVGIASALHKRPELSFGNIIGSNIINLTLVVAIPVLIAGVLELKSKMAQKTAVFTSIIAVLPILLIIDGTLSRADGLVLLICLALYVSWVLKGKKKFEKAFTNTATVGEWKEEPKSNKVILKDLTIFSVAVAILLLSAEGIVWSATGLASVFGVPLIIVSILLVALGTNIPELIFSMKAVSLKHKDMVLGNLMGSVIVNSTLVLGVTVLIYPLKLFNYSPYIAGVIFTIITLLFFVLFARTHKQIDRKEGVFLLVVYIAFVVVQFLIR